MHGVFFGASRGIGYLTAYLFLEQDASHTATLLLRKPDAMANDAKLGSYVASGRVKIVKGDAMVVEDVERALAGKVDFVLSTVGGTGTFSVRGGFQLTVPDVCTRSAIALVTALHNKVKLEAQSQSPGAALPRVIVMSSMGMADNHKCMPLTWRILYPWLLHGPHEDKTGLEYVIRRASLSLPTPPPLTPGAPHPAHSTIPEESILPFAEAATLPADFLPEVIICRPAFFSGAEEIPAAGPGGVKEDLCTYFTTRGHVARFVAERCLPGVDEWVNRLPVVGK